MNTMRPGARNLLDDVRASWEKLQEQKSSKELDVQFLPIARKDDIGMDALIEGISIKKICASLRAKHIHRATETKRVTVRAIHHFKFEIRLTPFPMAFCIIYGNPPEHVSLFCSAAAWH